MFDKKRYDLSDGPTYLSLGSNIGARERSILSAVRLMDSGSIRVMTVSSLYETAALGCAPMRDFVNAVVQVQSLLCGEDLLKRLQALEKRFGRQNGHNEPRTLDIDIIAMGGAVFDTNTLSVPHPRYQERLFVVAPLCEVAPGFQCPRTGQGIDVMLKVLTSRQAVTRISSRWMRATALTDRLEHVCSDQKQNDE